MNKVIIIGRLTREPEVRYSAGESGQGVARYTLAVDRRFKREGDATADFLNCVAFGRSAEFAEKYLHQGTKIVVYGRIQTGSYTNRDGQKVYTTDIVVEDQEFAESKAAAEERGVRTSGSPYSSPAGGSYSRPAAPAPQAADNAPADGFMNIPDGIEEELPFN